MRLYIIRHGDPDYETDSLTPQGREEAAALADYLPRLALTQLYTSPLGRARETASYSAKKLGMPVTVLPWASELTGVYYDVEGFGRAAPFTVPGEITYALQPTPRYEDWQDQKYFDHPRFSALIKSMEEGSDVLLESHGYKREGALYRVMHPGEDRVAVFCHQGLGTSWLAHLLRIPYQAAWAGLWQACSSITSVFMERRSEKYATPRMIQMGATPHIDLAGLCANENGLAWKV